MVEEVRNGLTSIADCTDDVARALPEQVKPRCPGRTGGVYL